MSQVSIASKRTVIAASQTDAAVEGGSPIIVHGVLCNNPHTTTQQFVFERFGTTTTEFTVNVQAGSNAFLYVKWFADAGLQVTTPGNGASVTVWHSHAGR